MCGNQILAEAASNKGACQRAVVWLRDYDSWETAWAECRRGDWMLWWATRYIGTAGDELHRRIVLILCEHLRPVLYGLPNAKDVEIIETWALGEHNNIRRMRMVARAAERAMCPLPTLSAVAAIVAVGECPREAAWGAVWIIDGTAGAQQSADIVRKYLRIDDEGCVHVRELP